MPEPKDHLANLALSILDACGQSDPPFAQLVRANLGDALEVIIGEPETDKVIGIPVAIWDRLRDFGTRLERLEKAAHLPSAHDVKIGDEGESVDIFGNRLRAGIRIAYVSAEELHVGTIESVGSNSVVVRDADGTGDFIPTANERVVVQP